VPKRQETHRKDRETVIDGKDGEREREVKKNGERKNVAQPLPHL